MSENAAYKPSDTASFYEQAYNISPPVNPNQSQPSPRVWSQQPASGENGRKKSFFGKLLLIIVPSLILAALAAFFLSSFFGNKKETVTLTYWGFWEERMIAPIILEFEKNNPSIKIRYEKQEKEQYREKTATRIQNGTGPDIYRFHNTWLPLFQDTLLPISGDIISKADFQKVYYPAMRRDLVRSGAIYGVPLEIDTLALFVNTDILRAGGHDIPKTWDEFLNIARATTVTDPGNPTKIKTAGASIGTFDNVNHAADIIALLLVQNGVDTRRVSGSAQNASDAFNFYTSFSQGSDKVWDDTLDPSLLAFTKGNVAMYFGYAADIPTIIAENPSLSFEIAPVPQLPDIQITIASYWVEGISLKTKYKKEAMRFVWYLNKKEAQRALFAEYSKANSVGYPFARADLAEEIKNDRYLSPFIRQAPFALPTYFISGLQDNAINNQLSLALAQAVRSVNRGESPESAVAAFSQTSDQIFSQYNVL